MNADELFLKSTNRHFESDRIPWNPTTLSNRVYGALARSGIDGLQKVDREIDAHILLDLVQTGKIWAINNIGEKAVKEICRWLVSELHLVEKN